MWINLGWLFSSPCSFLKQVTTCPRQEIFVRTDVCCYNPFSNARIKWNLNFLAGCVLHRATLIFITFYNFRLDEIFLFSKEHLRKVYLCRFVGMNTWIPRYLFLWSRFSKNWNFFVRCTMGCNLQRVVTHMHTQTFSWFASHSNILLAIYLDVEWD